LLASPTELETSEESAKHKLPQRVRIGLVKYVTERGGHEKNEDQVGKVGSGPPCLYPSIQPIVLPLDMGRALYLHGPRYVRWRTGIVEGGSGDGWTRAVGGGSVRWRRWRPDPAAVVKRP
jgi:hypothetical protein